MYRVSSIYLHISLTNFKNPILPLHFIENILNSVEHIMFILLLCYCIIFIPFQFNNSNYEMKFSDNNEQTRTLLTFLIASNNGVINCCSADCSNGSSALLPVFVRYLEGQLTSYSSICPLLRIVVCRFCLCIRNSKFPINNSAYSSPHIG